MRYQMHTWPHHAAATPHSLMSTIKNTTHTLNDLIAICKDGQEGFRDASEHLKSHELKTLLSQYSLDRSKFAGELQQLVIHLGQKEETKGGLDAALHRGWIDLKAALTKGSDHAILAECERGEDHAVKVYREAAEDADLPHDVREVIERQLAAVKAAHDDIRNRRDASADS